MRSRHVVVIGAGPAGLTAASELLRKGTKVLVLEKDPIYVGGLSRTVEWRGFRYDIGGHRFFSKNSQIVSWWRQQLGEEFIRVRRLSRIIYNDRFFDYPLKISNALNGLGLKTSGKCAMSYFKRQAFPVRPERSFEDCAINRFGDELYRIFFKTYTEKVWGIPCNGISGDWANQRIRGLTLWKALWNALGGTGNVKSLVNEFEYPRRGAGTMWERARDNVIKRGGTVLMGRSAVRFERSNDRVMAAWSSSGDGQMKRHEADAFIVSMPLRECIQAFGGQITLKAQSAAMNLKYRAIVIVFLLVRGENLFPDNWIYVHTPGLKVGRIQNLNNWSDGMICGPGITSLELEYFCSENEPLWKLSNTDLVDLAKSEIVQLRLARRDEILDGHAEKIEKAYPVYDADYRKNIELIQAELKRFVNFQVVGRNGMHKYNNQDHSMLTGMLAAENAANDGKAPYDVWRVNTDAEYLEAGKTQI